MFDPKPTVYVVVSEEERYGDYPTELLGVYLNESKAKLQVKALWKGHKQDDEGWCVCHGESWTYHAVEVLG